MKITHVRACQPDTPETPRDWRRSMGQILVAIETDIGLTGYGVSGGGLAGIHVVRTVLRDVLIDRDPDFICLQERFRSLLEIEHENTSVESGNPWLNLMRSLIPARRFSYSSATFTNTFNAELSSTSNRIISA